MPHLKVIFQKKMIVVQIPSKVVYPLKPWSWLHSRSFLFVGWTPHLIIAVLSSSLAFLRSPTLTFYVLFTTLTLTSSVLFTTPIFPFPKHSTLHHIATFPSIFFYLLSVSKPRVHKQSLNEKSTTMKKETNYGMKEWSIQ